jgi:hypothetical protein
MYPFRIFFTVTFTAGTLEGLTIQDSVGMVSQKSAEQWVQAVSSKPPKGKTFANFVIEAV